MNESELLQEISAKLSVLIGLQLEKEEDKTVQQKIVQLSRFGLTISSIAEILGTTTGTVSVLKSRSKKAR
jgi:DNA-binding CsgD family transcriptional regulator